MNEHTRERLEKLTIREKIGQLLTIAVLEDETGLPDERCRSLIREIRPAGVRVYGHGKRNTPLTKHGYVKTIRRWFGEVTDFPPLVSADCEAGISEIAELDVLSYPLFRGRAELQDENEVEDISYRIALQAQAMGFNMLHQPVLDVNTNRSNPVIGVRSFGDDPETVTRFAKASVRGLRRAGILTVGKHFPGHGATEHDSHLELPVIRGSFEDFDRDHLVVFRNLSAFGLDGIMTSHVVIESIDPDFPITLSRRGLRKLLREELGFQGFVISDAMTMKAIADHYTPAEAAVKAIQAGVDLVLASGDEDHQRETFSGLVQAVETGTITEDQLTTAAARVLEAKERIPATPSTEAFDMRKRLVPDRAEAEFSRSVFRRCAVLTGNGTVSPFTVDSEVIVAGVMEVGSMAQELAERGVRVRSVFMMEKRNDSSDVPLAFQRRDDDSGISEADLANVRNALHGCSHAIMIGYSKAKMSDSQNRLLAELTRSECCVVHIALGAPVDVGLNDIVQLNVWAKNWLGQPDPLPKPTIAGIVDRLLEAATTAS